MSSFNKVILMGNVTRDPEVKYLQNGTAVCDLGLAVNERRKNQAGEWVEEPVFVDCTAFQRTAEVAGEYLRKGSSCLIEGKLKLEQWEKDGQKRSKLKVIIERLQMIGGKRDAGDEYDQRPQGERKSSDDDLKKKLPPLDDDVPF